MPAADIYSLSNPIPLISQRWFCQCMKMTSLQSWLFLLQIKCLLVSGMRDVRKEVGNLNQTISSHDSHQSAESGWSFPDDYLSTRVRQTLSNATPIEGCDTAKLTEHIEKVETMWSTCALVETMMFFLISIAICSDLRGTQAKVSGGIGVVVAIGGLPLPAICGSMISTIVNNYCEIKKTLFADIDGAAKMYLNFKGDQVGQSQSSHMFVSIHRIRLEMYMFCV